MKPMFLSALTLSLCLVAGSVFAAGGSITSIKGDVKVRAGGGDWKDATEGQTLPANAEIKTGANSFAKIELGGKQVMVQPGKSVKLSELAGDTKIAANKLHSKFGKDGSTVVSVAAGVRANEGGAGAAQPVATDVPLEGEMDLVNKANTQATNGDVDGAIQTLSTYIQANPEAFRAHFHLAQKYLETQQYEEAVSHFRIVTKKLPSNTDLPAAFWGQMLCENASGMYQESNTTADTALSRYPSNPNTARWHLLKAYNFLGLDNNSQALVSLKAAREIALQISNELALDVVRNIGLNTANASLKSVVSGRKDVNSLLNEQRLILADITELIATLKLM